MRGPLKKVVWEEARRCLAMTLPEFRELTGDEIPTVCRLYGWKVGGRLMLYVLFQVNRHEDSFTLEIGWSREGRWPALLFMVNPPARQELATVPEGRFRLGNLWTGDDFWWQVDETRGVASQMDDAIRHLAQEGMNYFRLVAAASGVLLQEAARDGS